MRACVVGLCVCDARVRDVRACMRSLLVCALTGQAKQTITKCPERRTKLPHPLLVWERPSSCSNIFEKRELLVHSHTIDHASAGGTICGTGVRTETMTNQCHNRTSDGAARQTIPDASSNICMPHRSHQHNGRLAGTHTHTHIFLFQCTGTYILVLPKHARCHH